MKNLAKTLTLYCGAIAAFVGAYLAIGLPIPASSTDIENLNKQQTKIAVRAARNERRDVRRDKRDAQREYHIQKHLPTEQQSPAYLFNLGAELEDLARS
jgi:hypothetical protein